MNSPPKISSFTATSLVLLLVALTAGALLISVQYAVNGDHEPLPVSLAFNRFTVLPWTFFVLLFVPGIVIANMRLRGWSLLPTLLAYGVGCSLGWSPLVVISFGGPFIVGLAIGVVAVVLGSLLSLAIAAVARTRH